MSTLIPAEGGHFIEVASGKDPDDDVYRAAGIAGVMTAFQTAASLLQGKGLNLPKNLIAAVPPTLVDWWSVEHYRAPSTLVSTVSAGMTSLVLSRSPLTAAAAMAGWYVGASMMPYRSPEFHAAMLQTAAELQQQFNEMLPTIEEEAHEQYLEDYKSEVLNRVHEKAAQAAADSGATFTANFNGYVQWKDTAFNEHLYRKFIAAQEQWEWRNGKWRFGIAYQDPPWTETSDLLAYAKNHNFHVVDIRYAGHSGYQRYKDYHERQPLDVTFYTLKDLNKLYDYLKNTTQTVETEFFKSYSYDKANPGIGGADRAEVFLHPAIHGKFTEIGITQLPMHERGGGPVFLERNPHLRDNPNFAD